MASSKYIIDPVAHEHLEEIIAYISKRSSKGAIKVFNAMLDTFDSIAESPAGGSIRLRMTSRPVRFRAVYRYQVIYDPAAVPVRILHIYHGARDIKSLLARAHNLP